MFWIGTLLQTLSIHFGLGFLIVFLLALKFKCFHVVFWLTPPWSGQYVKFELRLSSRCSIKNTSQLNHIPSLVITYISIFSMGLWIITSRVKFGRFSPSKPVITEINSIIASDQFLPSVLVNTALGGPFLILYMAILLLDWAMMDSWLFFLSQV